MKDEFYANVWYTDRIDINTGNIVGWSDLTGLLLRAMYCLTRKEPTKF